ncbi:MAG TPA: YidC/Oxa1 family membrane protein insertase [Solirubrobacteraceae bacterium]|jgi:YidC/Oxa1 family membrane protein insertase|nr:YidC/Oxa1 family membrane protein insertase [Solirubrobacteraceae bacterium]
MLITANIFQPLIDVFAAVIKFYHDNLGASWGWSIVLLTVSVRLVMVPLSIRQFHSMRKMQHLQPQMKAIQKKYKEDKQRQQEEMMKFYRENDVNPLGSCLPLVAQFPVFISLYYMLRKNLRTDICGKTQAAFQAHYQKTYMASHPSVSEKTAHALSLGQTTACGPHYQGAGFLFVHDITSTATGVTLVLLIILYIGTQMASTLLMSAPTMDRTQRNMMMFLPVFFVLFIIRFPAGLIIYWITTNSWTMAQQYTIKRMMGPLPASAAVEDAGDDDEDGGGGLGALLRNVRGPRNDGDSSSRSAAPSSRTPATPPRPPRKKKKRSGRRR